MDTTKAIELKNAIEEISDLYSKMDMIKENIKEDIAAIAEKFDLPKKDVRKTAQAYYKQTFESEVSEMESFTLLYETIFKSKFGDNNV